MARWVSYIDNSVGDGANTIAGIISNGPTYGIGISSDVYITGLSTFGNTSRFTNTVRLDGQLRDGDNAFGSSGQVLSSDGTDTRWINAGELSAGAASQVAINDDSNTNAERFITIVDAASGNNNIKTDASLKYNPSTNTITTVNITGNVTGNVTGNASGSSGSCTGNAASATTLQNTRTIGGVSFNGSSDINLPGVNQAGNQNTSGNAGSATILANTRTIGGVSFNGSVNINLPGVNQAGNQNTSGNAATATVLETTRNFSISGEITANAQSFNGSGNVSLSATVDDNVIDEANLKISNSPTNGRFLQCNTGVSGGLTWADVTLPTSNTLSGSTLASGITASSITSLGTLTGLSVNGNASVTGTLTSGALTIDVNGTDEGATTLLTLDNYIDDISLEYTWIDFTFRDSNVNATPQVKIGAQAKDPTGSQVQEGTADFVVQCGVDNNSTSNTMTEMFRCSHETKITSVHHYPQTDSTFDLGTNSTRWRNVYSDNVYGNGSNLTSLNASQLSSGTVPDARLANSSLFVTGMIMMYTGSTAPSGWAICNGQNGTPDLRDRFIVGAGSAYSINNTGGAASVTLSTAQLPAHSHSTPSHSHSFSANTSSNTHNHTWDRQDAQNDQGYRPWPASNNDCVRTTANTGDNTHSHSVSGTTGNSNPSTNNTGSGNSHENRPPYYALMFIMKL